MGGGWLKRRDEIVDLHLDDEDDMMREGRESGLIESRVRRGLIQR